MTHRISRRAFGLGLAAGLSLPSIAMAGGKVQIKLGTLAPEGSEWFKSLATMGQRWTEASAGAVELRLFAGGVAGDEGDMVRKTRIGQLHAATVTNIGLGSISKATMALQSPMVIQSWEELDYVRDKISPQLEAELEKAGYVVLNWGDAGWVHFFTVSPVKTPDDLRKLKLFVWTGDPASADAWKSAKFTVVPLSSTEVLPALKTGMVQALQTTPVFALASQFYAEAKHMLRVNWSPLNGATVVAKKQWDKIDESLRPKLLKIAREEGAVLRTAIRTMSDDSVKTMVGRGLKVVEPDAATIDLWLKTAEASHPEIRGKVVPAEFFDRVNALVKEFRAGK